MVWQTLEAKLSTPRMSRYLKHNKNEQSRAAEAYVHNMRIAESFVSIFHVLEVALRNGIQKEMAIEYRRQDWYEAWDNSGNADLQKLYNKITDAKRALAPVRSRLLPTTSWQSSVLAFGHRCSTAQAFTSFLSL
jgi:hypothetical protein